MYLRARGLFVVRKRQQGVRGGNLAPCFSIFLHQKGRIWFKEDTVMRKKGFMVLGVTVAMSLSLPLLSYAGEWKEDNIGKWYQNDDGTYPISQWK